MRAYYTTRYRRQQLHAWIVAMTDAVWLGLLDAERLGQLDEHFYHETREDVDGERIGYEDDRYTKRGLAGWEQGAVERHFPPGGRILVTGAGGGREVLALLALGFDAVGYEPNPRLVGAA